MTPTSYGPADLAATVATGAGDALLWVGAAVGAAITVLFTFVGIRKAIGWARSMIEERRVGAGMAPLGGTAMTDADRYFQDRSEFYQDQGWSLREADEAADMETEAWLEQRAI